MPIYVIIDPPEKTVENKIPPDERAKLRDGVWLVWSAYAVSRKLTEELNLSSKVTNMVAQVSKFSGYADDDVVEKIREWEQEDAS